MEKQVAPACYAYFASLPNEHGWDMLPTKTGKIDWYCVHCGEETEIPWMTREPHGCKEQLAAAKKSERDIVSTLAS